MIRLTPTRILLLVGLFYGLGLIAGFAWLVFCGVVD
jgi:hypothetical protein